jgi:hypothetical protein
MPDVDPIERVSERIYHGCGSGADHPSRKAAVRTYQSCPYPCFGGVAHRDETYSRNESRRLIASGAYGANEVNRQCQARVFVLGCLEPFLCQGSTLSHATPDLQTIVRRSCTVRSPDMKHLLGGRGVRHYDLYCKWMARFA